MTLLQALALLSIFAAVYGLILLNVWLYHRRNPVMPSEKPQWPVEVAGWDYVEEIR